jgi:hypothetical protein
MEVLQTEIMLVWNEVFEFLVTAPTPEAIIAFQPSDKQQTRVSDLLERNRSGILTPDERAELEEYSRLNHFMRMLKAHARKKLMQL